MTPPMLRSPRGGNLESPTGEERLPPAAAAINYRGLALLVLSVAIGLALVLVSTAVFIRLVQ